MADGGRAARHVVLVGAMGVGKTTVGRRVADALGVAFVDNDEVLVRTTGASAAAVAEHDGVDELHRREAAIVLDALRAAEPSVIAAAASTVTDASVRSELGRSAWVVWLRAAPEVLVARLPDSATRPFRDRDPVGLVRDQSRARDPLFAAVADATFETDRVGADAVAASVAASAGERGPRMDGKEHRRTR